MTAVFRLDNGHWIDYVGFLTTPALIGNVLAAFLLPQVWVAGARQWSSLSRSL